MISERKRENCQITHFIIMTTLQNSLRCSSCEQKVEDISKFILNIWNSHPFNRVDLHSQLEELIGKKVSNELNESEAIRLAAFEKSFDFDVKYSIDSWWELDAPNSINAPVFACESFEQARDIMNGDEDPEEPSQEDIIYAANLDVVEVEETEVIVEVSNVEVKTNAL